MHVFYSPVQKKHVTPYEVQYGKIVRGNDKVARVDSIMKVLKADKQFRIVAPETLPDHALAAVHDEDYLDFLRLSQHLQKGETISPYVFPCDPRIATYLPIIPKRAGYYCFDAGTSLMSNTWPAALASASGAYAASEHTKRTGEATYALCRPPGHHATKNMFGGYCYLNNAAIAAKNLSKSGKVMVVDIDYHHGNGTQSIFYDSPDVLYFSIHAHPSIEYPYFTGYEDEIGIDDGVNYNINVPLAPFSPASEYLNQFLQGLEQAFRVMVPDFIVISAGFDTEANDPIGHFNMMPNDFHTLGREFKQLGKRTVVLQEGGYLVSALGTNVCAFLKGLLG